MRKIFFLIILVLELPVFCQHGKSTQKGIELFENGKYELAKEFFEQIIEENDKDPQANYYLGMTYYKLGDLDEAIDYCEEAAELDDNNPKYHFQLGQLYAEDIRDASIFRQPGIAGDMKDAFKRAVELDPDNLDAQASLVSFYINAPGIMGGDYDLAKEHIDYILTKDEMRGNLELALLYSAQGDEKKVEAQYILVEEKFGIDSDNYTLYNTWGYYLLGKGRVDEAIDKFKKQVKLAPEKSNPHDSLGEGYRAKGMLEESLTEYKLALELNSSNSNIIDIIEELEEEIASTIK